jgi:hypothetical protein
MHHATGAHTLCAYRGALRSVDFSYPHTSARTSLAVSSTCALRIAYPCGFSSPVGLQRIAPYAMRKRRHDRLCRCPTIVATTRILGHAHRLVRVFEQSQKTECDNERPDPKWFFSDGFFIRPLKHERIEVQAGEFSGRSLVHTSVRDCHAQL